MHHCMIGTFTDGEDGEPLRAPGPDYSSLIGLAKAKR